VYLLSHTVIFKVIHGPLFFSADTYQILNKLRYKPFLKSHFFFLSEVIFKRTKMLTGHKMCCGNVLYNEFATGWRSYGVGVGSSQRDPNLRVR